MVQGKVIAVKPPDVPFPQELTVAYRDQADQEHQVIFRPVDVYVVRELGELVEVRYLPEAPDQPLGPARFRDAAFLKYTPWGIGIVAAYLLLQVAVGTGAWLMRWAKTKANVPIDVPPQTPPVGHFT